LEECGGRQFANGSLQPLSLLPLRQALIPLERRLERACQRSVYPTATRSGFTDWMRNRVAFDPGIDPVQHLSLHHVDGGASGQYKVVDSDDGDRVDH
jgi:hypothetical protein